MRIVVHDAGNHFDAQTRAYAERSVLLTLANVANVVQHAIVRLGHVEYAAADAGSHCIASLSVHLRLGREVSLASHGQHPSDAIDRVVSRLAAAVETHVMRSESTASGLRNVGLP